MAGIVKKDRWNAGLYDEKHRFVSTYGEDLLEWLAPRNGEKILDLGCGTGDLANKLAEMGAVILGVDQSENMIQQAQKKYPHIPFQVEDVVTMTFSGEFDAVFSNATLHWVKEPRVALQNIYRSLKKGGRFVAEFGGKGNVATITNAIIRQLAVQGFDLKPEQFPWYYPSIGEYTSLMEQVGFRVTTAQHFDRPTPLSGAGGLRNWIEMFAQSLFTGVSTEIRERVMAEVEEEVKEVLWQKDQWVADYKRIRVIGIKE